MATRRKPGTGTIQYDKTRNTFIARTGDRSRSGRFATRKAERQPIERLWKQ